MQQGAPGIPQAAAACGQTRPLAERLPPPPHPLPSKAPTPLTPSQAAAAPEQQLTLVERLKAEAKAVLFDNKMNVLLLLTPFAFISAGVGWPAAVTFILALLPLCSLAEVRTGRRLACCCPLRLLAVSQREALQS
jgi:hypothetical protein